MSSIIFVTIFVGPSGHVHLFNYSIYSC